MGKNNCTDTELREMRRLSESGLTLAEISGAVGRPVPTVWRALDRMGQRTVRRTRPRHSAEQKKVMVERYLAGEASTAIARDMGCEAKTVVRAVKAAGGQIDRGRHFTRLTDAEMKRAVQMSDAGMDHAAIAAELRRSARIITSHLRPLDPTWVSDPMPSKRGYMVRFIGPNHWLAPMGRRTERLRLLVDDHRYVMATTIGRPLLPTESVHHINGVRDDNRPSNLQLRHQRSHGPGAQFVCGDCGSKNVQAVPI